MKFPIFRAKQSMAVLPIDDSASDGAMITAPSAGLNHYDPDHDDHESLLARAGSALYAAKQRGRNRVEVFTSNIHTVAG